MSRVINTIGARPPSACVDIQQCFTCSLLTAVAGRSLLLIVRSPHAMIEAHLMRLSELDRSLPVVHHSVHHGKRQHHSPQERRWQITAIYVMTVRERVERHRWTGHNVQTLPERSHAVHPPPPPPPHPTTPNVLGLVHQQSDPNESQTAIELLISTAIFPIPSELSDSNTGLPKVLQIHNQCTIATYVTINDMKICHCALQCSTQKLSCASVVKQKNYFAFHRSYMPI